MIGDAITLEGLEELGLDCEHIIIVFFVYIS